jgi:hypothetical protein
MKALTQAARAICYCCAHAIDRGHAEGDEGGFWKDRAGLLTPIAKAFSTDVGVEVASLGVQVHGGMGYIEETGAAALLRDARIAPIYEGTNGIQAIDLVTRKLTLDGGRHMLGLIGEFRQTAEDVAKLNRPGFGRTADELGRALDDMEAATGFLQAALSEGRMDEALAGATPYLRLAGLAVGGGYLARAGLAGGDPERIALCRFFAENLVGETATLKARILEGAESLGDAARALVSG